MKVGPWLCILVSALVLIVASSGAQSAADRPPGVDENSWVPLSDSAGIVLTNVRRMPDLALMPEAMRLQLQQLNVQTVVGGRGIGILMVKRGGGWMRVDLELPPARVQPLQ